MKVDYRVRLKGTYVEGQAIEEFGSADDLKIRVYWGTTSDGAVHQPLRHIKVHNANSLERLKGTPAREFVSQDP